MKLILDKASSYRIGVYNRGTSFSFGSAFSNGSGITNPLRRSRPLNVGSHCDVGYGCVCREELRGGTYLEALEVVVPTLPNSGSCSR
jgi:hypothetical protein